MYVARVSTRLPLSKQTSAQLVKAASGFAQNCGACTGTTGLRLGSHHAQSFQSRHFSSTPRTQLREIFPEADTPQIRKTEAAWPHEPYTLEEMRSKVFFAHRQPKNMSDRVALYMVRFLRYCMDTATGYRHDVGSAKTASDANAVVATNTYHMSERKWLIRMIFLESVAAVPGMVGGMLRHLRSLRALKRDNGWIETLIEEAYNERMHLLTFLKMAEPGWFMKIMIIGAQGVFFNSMFLSYLVSPRTCHRFVGYLEEEAVLTYTLAIQDIEEQKLPKWTDPNFKVPELAVNYWKMPEGSRTMRDLLLYIRADEAKHREVNHTLGNLKQKEDPNPYVSEYKDSTKPHPTKGIETMRPLGWEREEVI
jgi:hypothetical protein